MNYHILIDNRTKSFYMNPGDIRFFAYTDIDNYTEFLPNAVLVTTEYEEQQDFFTYLYNSGFLTGFLDGKEVRISRGDITHYKINSNEMLYAQYILTGEEKYLKMIKKKNLYTLCDLGADKMSVYFPTVTLDTGEVAVLTYTDGCRIPPHLRKKYEGWRTVRMTWDALCVVNNNFVAF